MREDGTSETKSGDSNANVSKDQPVTISAPPAAAVTIDPQNPLPEASFFYRRVLTFAICIFACVLASFTAGWLFELGNAELLYRLTRLVIYGAGVILTYYFIAPSAAELTNLVQSASIIRHSLTMASERAASDALGRAGARFEPSGTAESQIPTAAAGGPFPADSGEGTIGETPDDIPTGVGASDPSSR